MQEVLDSHEAIEVFVKGQEGLPDLVVVACNLRLHLQVKLFYTIRYKAHMSLLVFTVLAPYLNNVSVLVTLVLFV